MKFLMFVIAVAALVWLLKRSLQRHMPPPRARPMDLPAPQPMVRCAQCGTHLPRDEAVAGPGGVFCDVDHRAAYQRAHPPR